MTLKHPDRIEDVTADWMTWALREGGVCREASVTEVEITSICGGGTGYLSGIARVLLEYDREEQEFPRSVVIKLPTVDALGREFADSWNLYEREVRFYREIAPRSPIRTPRCYFSLLDTETQEYILIIEDVSSCTFGDQVKGLAPEQAVAAIQSIGTFHAHWWNSPALPDLEWMPEENLDVLHLFAQNWPEFRHQFYDSMTDAERVLGDRLNWQGDRLAELNAQAPSTIAHSDFRADNLVFDESSSGQSVIVLDWQAARRNSGAFDVARLVSGSVQSEYQAGRHRDFVRVWHDQIIANGIEGYSRDQAWRDYQAALLSCLYIPVAFHHHLSSEGGRGSELARAISARFFKAAVECEAAAVLDEP